MIDQIDEWLNRVSPDDSKSRQNFQKQPEKKNNQPFKNGVFHENRGNFKKQNNMQRSRQGYEQRPRQEQRPQQRPQPRNAGPTGPQQRPAGQRPQPQYAPRPQQRPPQRQPQRPQPRTQPRPQPPRPPQRPQPRPQRPQPRPQPRHVAQQQPRPPQQRSASTGRFARGTKNIHKPKDKQKPIKPHPILPGKLRIIPLGGLNEVGKNMMAFEYENDIIVVDMGFEFPSEDLYGVDYVIPDTTYLEENRKRIRAVIITHGHLDHIGGVPYILPKLDYPPVYGTPLTMGLIRKRLDEFKLTKLARLHTIDPKDVLKFGHFTCSFFRVVHSIPDSVGVVIDTPVGKLVHTGDFKFDDEPLGSQKPADLDKIFALGKQNVLALFSDSTNSMKKGHAVSEQQVGKTLDELIKNTKGRIIVASFSSLIGRIQQIIDSAQKYNRKIFISGRSLKENMEIASKLSYLHYPKDLIKDIKQYKNTQDHEALIMTTGSQGEALSALSRIAVGEHASIKVKKGDTIILSSSPIIGNERAIYSVINKLCLLGATVINSQIMDVHTSGHAYQEDLKKMIEYVRPKYFVPVHGEFFMRQAHAFLAEQECGIPNENIIMIQNGDVLLAEKGRVHKSNETVETKYILIDGLGEGQMGSQVQVDRAMMAKNGALMVLIYVDRKNKKLLKAPDVVSRGFLYMHESQEVTEEVSRIAAEAYNNMYKKNPGADRKDFKRYVQQTVDKYTNATLDRRPLIVPLIIES